MFDTTLIPDWFKVGNSKTQDYGRDWVHQQRSLVLVVLSYVAHMERNFLINPAHPDSNKITQDLHQPVYWDARLFRVY